MGRIYSGGKTLSRSAGADRRPEAGEHPERAPGGWRMVDSTDSILYFKMFIQKIALTNDGPGKLVWNRR